MSTKVIIDTDTGIDDGMGLIYGLLSPELDVVAVTTVFGNVGVDLVTRNTALIMEWLGAEAIPLAGGAARAFVGTPTFNPEVHGSDGFGDAQLGEPKMSGLVAASAAQLTIDIARRSPGEVTWIGLGPITNLALAVLLDPMLPTYLPRVVWMGGAVSVPGNVTPVAEADAKHDPEALAIVLEQPWDITLVGLDVTDDTIFRPADLEVVAAANTPAARIVSAIAPFYMRFYEPILGEYGCAMHSPLTVAIVAHPELITRSQRLPMWVELAGVETRGMTVADRRRGQESSARPWMEGPSVLVLEDVDRPAFITKFVARITGSH